MSFPRTHKKLRKLMLEPTTHQLLFRLHRHKTRQNRRDIQNGTSRQINTLLRILFCLAVGHIPLHKNHFDLLAKSKRRLLLRKIRFNLHSILDSGLEERKNLLLQFASLYPALLWPLFNTSKPN